MLKLKKQIASSFSLTTPTIQRFLDYNNTTTTKIMSFLTKGFHNLSPSSTKTDPFHSFPFARTKCCNNNNAVYIDTKSLNINHNHSDPFSGFGLRFGRRCGLPPPRNQLLKRSMNGGDGGGGVVNDLRFVNGYGGKRIVSSDLVSLTEKIMVAVDVDEVLGNFVSALNSFVADHYSEIHSVSDYYVYEFFKIWNCSRYEGIFLVAYYFHPLSFVMAFKILSLIGAHSWLFQSREFLSLLVSDLVVLTADTRVHEFFKTPYFKTGIHPIPGAQRALNKLSDLCKLSVVTSRQNIIKDHTIEWIEKHYPGVFQEIHFGNHFALHGESRPKSEICRSLGAKVLIDDNPRYAIECAEVGIRVLLFDYQDSYPWCKSDLACRHPLVTKVHNWEQVEVQLVSWITT